MNLKKKVSILIVLLIVLSNVACINQWSFLIKDSEKEIIINKKIIQEYQYLINEESNCNGIPLEIIFYQIGINSIDSIHLFNQHQKNQAFAWGDIADEACVTEKGTLVIHELNFQVKEIIVNPSQFNDLQTSLLDIFPTSLTALNIHFEREMYTSSMIDFRTEHVVLLFLDGFNNDHYLSAVEKGLMRKISKSNMYEPALSVYPPKTTIASAAILTGKSPNINGVFKSGIRQTKEKTIFDFVVKNNLSVISIEGESLPFNLSNSEIILSGDKDGNGSTDDNVFLNTLSIIETGLPNLLYIHFHGIDDMGHAYGPNSTEVWEKIEEIDGYLEEIIHLLPKDCMVITFSDHGMHGIAGKNDKGNHGNLIDEDMVVFINILIT